MSTLAVKVIDRLFLVAYGTAPPTALEWERYLGTVKAHGIDRTMQLIVTDGGEPDARQRHELHEILGDRTVPVAVVSSSARVRGTVTALSWFNRRIRAFPPSALRDALAYLEIPQSRWDLLEREMDALQREIGQGDRLSA